MLPQPLQPAQLQPAGATVDVQPRNATEMNPINSPQRVQQSPYNEQRTNEPSRLRGGGAAKDCFISAIGLFLCFESCEFCCDCIGDIICCPCEMCC